jgi:hypothetical protein
MITIPTTPRFKVTTCDGGLRQVIDLSYGTSANIVAVKFYTVGRRNHSWQIVSTDEDGSRSWSVSKDEEMVQALTDWQEDRRNKPRRQEFFYYFESGGWNSEYATSIEEARKKAEARWADCQDLNPLHDSFKPVNGNEHTYRALTNLFH